MATLRYLPEPDELVMPAEGLTLVVNDGSDVTPALCAELTANGHQLVVLTWGTDVNRSKQSFPEGVTEYVLTDLQEETIQRTLAQFGNSVSQLIYLHPRQTTPVNVLTFATEAEKALLKAAFLIAKWVKPALNQDHWQTRPAFLMVVRQDGAFGLLNSGHDAILGGGLTGLTKSLNLEWPGVFCRTVDVSPNLTPAAAAQKIRQELYDANQCLLQTAYTADGQRQTLVAEPVAPFTEPTRTAQLDQNSVFLVTGGGRGITASCVNQLAATFQCTFILLGRTELSAADPAWADGLTDPTELKRQAMKTLQTAGEKPLPRTVERMVSDVLAQRDIRTNLTELQNQGARAFYRAIDVTDAAAVQAVLAEVTPLTGPVTGLIHGAGRLADKRIEQKTGADFDAVFDVKIQGLASVMQALTPAALRHIVLFSSVAGFYGNVGQTDYAMANEVLNRFAYLFRKNFPLAHTVSINWGAWDSGMVSPELKKMLLAQRVSFVPSDEGPAAMIDQLSVQASEQVQVILGGTLPVAKAETNTPVQTYTVLRTLTPEANPFLAHHVIQGHAVLPINMANSWLAQTAENLYPGFKLYREKNVKLFNGVVFDGTQPTNFQVVIQEQQKSENEIQVLATILSQPRTDEGPAFQLSGPHQPTGRPLPRYQAQITLVPQRPAAPVETLPDLTAPFLADASVLYEDGTLFHGSDFQGVKQIISLDEQGVLLLCEHPGVTWERQGQFPISTINGFLTDIMYQGLLIWVRRFHGSACLPLRTDGGEIFGELSSGRSFYVSLRVVKSTDFTMEADLTAFDALTGEVSIKTYRASVTISRDLQWTQADSLLRRAQ
ncbi:SDR family NAD(P)-dependent oxidoreductase [Spirosoma fluminis]